MALATRELELVIIARDRTSAVLARVGGALAILGAGVARVGAEGIGFFAEVTGEAIDFRKTVALAFTQVEIEGATLNDTLELIRDSARKTAVPIEDLADSAFDIFSTLTLDNMDQARVLLDLFAQSAVAGDAPIRDIGRATIAWLNALNLAPTAENATRILENQFELVRKGAGTYTEFANVMGKAIPPFVAANQTVETMSASLAFLTRNGLSAAEASTSASRAVELLFGPKAIKGLASIGIEITDSNGRFRDMRGLLTDVVEEFRGMDDASKVLKFKEIFGQGRIQARRFFNLILAEGNFEEFLFLLDAVEAGAGNVAEAFDIMMAEPAVQLELIKNRFVVLRQEIGDVFIPFLTGKLFPIFDRLLDFWEDLDDIQKINLVKWAAFGTVFLTIAGSITAVVGGLVLIVGILKAFGIGFGAILIKGGGFALLIAAIAAAISLAIIDWEKFKEIFGPWWDTILDRMQPVVDWLKRTWPEAWAIAEDAYQTALKWFEEEWPTIWENFKTNVQSWLENTWPGIWENAKGAVASFGQFFVDLWEVDIRPAVERFITWIKERWALIWEDLKTFFSDFVEGDWTSVWEEVKKVVEDVLPDVIDLVIALAKLVIGVFGLIAKVVQVIWNRFGDDIIETIRIIVMTIGILLESLVKNAQGIVNVITGILTLDPGLIATGFVQIGAAQAEGLAGVWNVAAAEIKLAQDIISGSSDVTESDIDNFVDSAIRDLERLRSAAATKSRQIRESFTIMNPAVPRSPPLTRAIADSFKFIQNTVGERMKNIARIADTQGSLIRDSLSQIQPRSVTPALATVGTQGPAIETQINIAKLESTADPFEIAQEIGWKVLNS